MANMWTCQHCSETNEASFDICWNCGTTQTGVLNPSFQKADDLPSEHSDAVEVQSEQDHCLCPRCHADVDEDATQCAKCGELFPAMADRQALNTPATYDAFRWLVVAAATVIAIAAIGQLIVHFILSLFTIGD